MPSITNLFTRTQNRHNKYINKVDSNYAKQTNLNTTNLSSDKTYWRSSHHQIDLVWPVWHVVQIICTTPEVTHISRALEYWSRTINRLSRACHINQHRNTRFSNKFDYTIITNMTNKHHHHQKPNRQNGIIHIYLTTNKNVERNSSNPFSRFVTRCWIVGTDCFLCVLQTTRFVS